MDIKQLYDILKEEGIGLDIDSQQDAIHPWTMALIASDEDFDDTFHDDLDEIKLENHRKMQQHIVKGLENLHNGTNCRTSHNLQRLYFSSAADRAAYIGNMVMDVIYAEAEKRVIASLHDWFMDCIGYEADMEECMREDAQEAREDR
jgi:hypothetical protein